MLNGRCMCGGISFGIDGELPTHDGGGLVSPSYCHCKTCQRMTGSAFAVGASVPTDQFRWLSGEELIKPYQSSPGVVRSFCSECGSSLSYQDTNAPLSEEIFILLGVIDEPFDHKPHAHIFVANKASWYEINDDLVPFDAFPEEPAQ